MGHYRPDLKKSFNPWDRIAEPESLQQLLMDAGIHTTQIKAEASSHPLQDPEDWWKIALGSGYRGTLDQLDSATLANVRRLNLTQLYANQVQVLTTNVLYAVAHKS